MVSTVYQGKTWSVVYCTLLFVLCQACINFVFNILSINDPLKVLFCFKTK